MNISEFENLHGEKHWAAFHYLSENQEGYDCANPLTVELSFQQMTICTHPSVVYLRGNGGSLRLDRVRWVECKGSVIGDVLRVSCANPRIEGGMVEYTIVAK